MQKKSNINWWAVLAVIIIGGSVGFVGTAYFKKKQESQNKQELAVQAKDSVNSNSYSNEADPSDIETDDSEDVEPDDDDINESKPKLTLKEAQSIVLGGGKNDKIPDDCMTVVNGKSNTYGKFRQTVGSYSIVRVEDLDYNEKNEVTKVVITALNTAPDSKSEPDLKPKVDDEKKRLAAEAAAEKKRLAAEEAARKKAADDEKKRLAAEAAAEKKRLAAEEAARKKAADDEKKRLAAEAAAEKKRLEAEEAARKKAADAEKKRLAAEEDARKKADQAQKLNLLKSDAQGIVASGRTDSRFPDNCKVVGNGVNTTYKQFRTNVANKSYESVKVVSVTPDKNGNASQIKVTVVRPDPNIIKKEKEKLEKEEKERKEKEELARRNNELKNEVQGIVAKGQRSSKVPDDCTILVNGRNKKDYQSFRMGVNLRAYSNVKVTSVSTDSKGNVTQINVSATESKDSE